MAANRLIDAKLDALNPRTAARAIPRGLLSRKDMLVLALAGLLVLFVAAWRLNPLCLQLAPLAAFVVVGYSYTKRFTWLSHAVLGLSDGIAPAGGWIAVTGSLGWPAVILTLAVALWIGGFDLIYACQDVEFDRETDLHSVPARFGLAVALWTSAICHVLTILCLALVGWDLRLGVLYWAGLALASILLTYEHWLVRPNDLSKLNVAFFNVNGYIAVIVFVFTMGGLYV
jgi:4-hydroxybenzoate polyprenyltransferase